MSHEIDNVDHHWAGDTLHLQFIVWDGDSDEQERKDLEGATIDWTLYRPWDETAVLDLDAPDVSHSMTDAPNGEFEIQLNGATEDLGTECYSERLSIADFDGNRSTYGAKFMISDPSAPSA